MRLTNTLLWLGSTTCTSPRPTAAAVRSPVSRFVDEPVGCLASTSAVYQEIEAIQGLYQDALARLERWVRGGVGVDPCGRTPDMMEGAVAPSSPVTHVEWNAWMRALSAQAVLSDPPWHGRFRCRRRIQSTTTPTMCPPRTVMSSTGSRPEQGARCITWSRSGVAELRQPTAVGSVAHQEVCRPEGTRRDVAQPTCGSYSGVRARWVARCNTA